METKTFVKNGKEISLRTLGRDVLNEFGEQFSNEGAEPNIIENIEVGGNFEVSVDTGLEDEKTSTLLIPRYSMEDDKDNPNQVNFIKYSYKISDDEQNYREQYNQALSNYTSALDEAKNQYIQALETYNQDLLNLYNETYLPLLENYYTNPKSEKPASFEKYCESLIKPNFEDYKPNRESFFSGLPPRPEKEQRYIEQQEIIYSFEKQM